MAGVAIQDIRRHIRSVQSIEHITNAMRLVSAAKLNRAKAVFERTQGYLHIVTDCIDELFNNVGDIPSHYVLGKQEIKRTCYIVVTSNRGLAGSFNISVIKAAEKLINENKSDPMLVCIGSKGRDHFLNRDYEVFSEYHTPPESVSFVSTREISKPIVSLFDRENVDEIVIVYTAFLSMLEQRVQTKRLLPFEAKINPDVMQREKQIEYEPSAKEVFNYLVPKYVEIMIYQAIIESATCEHAARRLAMESATDNARDMMGELGLQYNRARQAAITREITEIVSGADAVNG
jgi:F-type H+-transporting ATPase subunit gamma